MRGKNNANIVGHNYKSLKHDYNFSGLTFPTPIDEIKTFEKNNENTSVNVYGLSSKKRNGDEERNGMSHLVYPLRVVTEEKSDHFDLLLVSNSTGGNHYAYITDFGRLVQSQMTKNTSKMVFCKRCFLGFNFIRKKYKLSGFEALKEHKKICGENKSFLPIMPEEGTTLQFEAFEKMQEHPFSIYCDFESLLERVDKKMGDNTRAIQEHKPMSYCFLIKAADSVPVELLNRFDISTEPKIYRGNSGSNDVAARFVKEVCEEALKIEALLKTNVGIVMTDEETAVHAMKTNCDLCKMEFSDENYKVADHNHLSGKYRHTLCNNCNLKLKTPTFVPCFFHGLSNYDAHFLVRELSFSKGRISLIPSTEEKYISFSKYVSNTFTVRFVDTYRFMGTSLATLANNLRAAGKHLFEETAKVFSAENIDLVTRKGVYPYSFTSNYDVLETTELPSKKDFYNELTESHISDEDYVHAQTVWKHFNCKNLGEYSDLYLKTDVTILADVFSNFKKLCLKKYRLEPSYYYTSPGLSFDAMLLHTAVKLELISDYEKQIFISRGIRGGMTNSILKYAQANNLKTPNYDAEKPKSEIIYLDVNNLYGWSMSQNLPYAGFRWIDEDHETVLKRVREMDEDSDIGLALEVTVTYPEGKHDMHNEMPFLPENRIPPNSKAKKLLSTLETKEHYVVHYLNLQQAMENGLKVEKVHKVLEFKQSRWLSKYIKLNTEMRQAATNDFEKDFFKLMNNSVFGKCMERVEFRKKMELVCDPKRAAKLIKKHTFNHCVTYKENLSIFVLDNKIIHFTKPVYAGFCILDISKTLVYDFHYNYMKKHFKDRIMLMYGDTDSLVYYVLTENFYAEIKEHPELMERFDTSSLPKDHFCYSAARKKVPGLWSDECGGKAILEFVSLRTKAYGFDVEGTEKSKPRG
ncbi:uncharacterized protein LOC126906698 [Daktulosphaira vitifoliae]|uniref:uncharacterized protein LOC126906698 n=1 Tax=Daktulosphaira vitifoliae TaxID=58002 RepID=UPI0021AA6007|nr:uncharacterized protein LOC126906698 [Daktulosphaira vitifoliae]